MNKKKLFRFLLYHNWVWTLPIAIGTFLISRLINVNWLSALIGTAGSMAGLFVIARLCLWFFFRKLYEYFYGAKTKPHYGSPQLPANARTYYNHSFMDFVKTEPRIIKLIYATVWFILIVIMAFVIFLKLL